MSPVPPRFEEDQAPPISYFSSTPTNTSRNGSPCSEEDFYSNYDAIESDDDMAVDVNYDQAEYGNSDSFGSNIADGPEPNNMTEGIIMPDKIMLPLQHVYTRKIPMSKVGGDSKSQSTTTAYTFSITETLQRLYSNPELCKAYHFGLGEENGSHSEAYHGALCKESILASASSSYLKGWAI
ncbi:hypothetical protein RUND412_010200 [Rhizina undulata]